MSSPEHGAQAGGHIVVQHQTEEAMAAVLLARKGKSTVVWKIQISYFSGYLHIFVPFQEKESVFLLDDKRISEINMVSGRTRKRTPKLHPLLSSVVTMTSSCNGEFYLSVSV